MMEGETPVASFEVSVAPDAILVASVRRFVGELCARTLNDVEITSKVVVAVHELLDNAVRHCSEAPCAIRLDVSRAGDEVRAVVVTRNRANQGRRRELERVLEEMRRSGDSGAFYRALFDRVIRGGVEGAGLGLGRISAEAGFALSSRVDDDVVVVRAEGRFPLASR